MANEIQLNISKEFSQTPGPRYEEEGDFSGREFRKKILEPKFLQALSEGKRLRINLDGTFGYGTSFLEEAFGGLARDHGPEKVLKIVDFISIEEPYLIGDIEQYVKEATK